MKSPRFCTALVVALTVTAGACSASPSTQSTSNGATSATLVAAAVSHGPISADAMASVSAISADMTQIGNDADLLDVRSLATDCANMKLDVAIAMQRTAGIPEASRIHLVAAYRWFDLAATDCITGATEQDTAALNRTSAELHDGTAELKLATAALEP